MNDSTHKTDCGCNNSGSNSGVGSVSTMPTESGSKILKAQVAQTYDTRFNVRIVPARSLVDSVSSQPRCKPRGNKPGWTGPSMSSGLVDALASADRAMMEWLARDKGNAQRFLADPVGALRDAGVHLDRARLKELVRARTTAETTQRVPPGATVHEVTAEAFPNGRVGSISVRKPGGPGGDVHNTIHCGPRRKG